MRLILFFSMLFLWPDLNSQTLNDIYGKWIIIDAPVDSGMISSDKTGFMFLETNAYRHFEFLIISKKDLIFIPKNKKAPRLLHSFSKNEHTNTLIIDIISFTGENKEYYKVEFDSINEIRLVDDFGNILKLKRK